MFLIYIVIVIAFIDTFSQLPIITPFSISVGAGPIMVGIIIGMYSFSNIIGNLLSGIWIDKIGPKRILTMGMLFVSVIIVSYAFVSNPYQLLFVRFLHGLAGGFIVPAAFTLISIFKKSQSEGRKMAYSGAAVGGAAVLGPALGAVITGQLGFVWLFYILAIFMATFGLFSAFFIKKGISTDKKKVQFTPSTKRAIFKNKSLLEAYLSIYLLLFTLGILTYSLPLKVEILMIRSEMTGILLSVFGLVSILMFILPTNHIYDLTKKSTLMKLGLFLVSISLFTLFISNNLFSLIIAMIIYGLGFSFLFPSTSSTVIEYSKEQKRGIAFGIFYACFSFGVISGSFFAGALPSSSTYSFLIGGILLILVQSVFIIRKFTT